MLTHISLDIETLGTRPGFIVLSAAFVRFSDYASTSCVLDRAEQQSLGLLEDAVTLEWWQNQPNEAWRAAVNNPVPLRSALQHFSDWLQWAAQGGELLIWCHGASFDAPLLQEVYRLAGMTCPWHFAAVRDTRTLYDLAGVDVAAYRTGTAHVALDDAMAQTKAANEALRILSGARAVA